MSASRGERRLAAVLAADMVGYSRLMEADEAGTLARQRAHRDEVIDPAIAEHDGRIVKTTGDGMLVEFASVVDAVASAARIQQAMAEREAERSEDVRIRYRIGINLGDIVIEGDDIFGDGVNIAARLEGLAEPGGICVSDVVRQSVEGRLDLAFEDIGLQSLKNISRPVRAWQWRAEAPARAGDAGEMQQEIRFCTSADGTLIAYAVHGDGPPLVKAPNWLNHLEHDWESPVWGHLLREFAKDRTFVRFDQRANGLSDWDVEKLDLDAMVGDLAAVVDAAGLARFPLFAISQGCSYSIAYAVRHPERVSRLVLYGGFAQGGRVGGGPADIEREDMYLQMIRQGWGQDNPAFRQFFTSLFVPGASREQMDAFNEMQRVTASPENAARLRRLSTSIDVRDLLAQVNVPTLVLHCRDDGIVPFERGRRMAAGIPGARFVTLEGQNHLLLADEPAWPRFLEEVRRFLAEDEG